MSDEAKQSARAAQPSMQDVATAAGVALGTVSNVLNHPQRVAESTRLRVQQAIAELGFVRNANARSLAGGSTDSIALIVPDLGNSLFVDMSKGAQAEAREHGLSLLIASSADSLAEHEHQLEAGLDHPVDGPLRVDGVEHRGLAAGEVGGPELHEAEINTTGDGARRVDQGGPRGDRTHNPRIKSPLLCQLS